MDKWICKNDECEQAHCKKCGHHFDPSCGRGGVCDGCLVERAMRQSENLTKAYGGNYEAANLAMGW